MAPPKFDDLSKPAKDLLTDDYQVDAKGFKAKVKTDFTGVADLYNFSGVKDGSKDGATLTTAVDLNFSAKPGLATPTKLTWKFPKPLGVAGIAFDKLEVDKAGKMKLECSLDKALHGVADLKLECKSDLSSMASVAVGGSYTGISNAFCKAEVKVMDVADYTAEAGYTIGGGASVSVKSTKASAIDVGAQYVNGPLTLSAITKDAFTAYSFHGFYKASSDLKLGCSYNFGGKTNGEFSAGMGYTCCEGMSVKSKVTGGSPTDLAVSTSVKKELAKGVTVIAGAKMPTNPTKDWSWGVQVNIE